MDTYDWDVLIKRWEVERITEVQVIGQLLLHGKSTTDLLRSVRINVAKRQVKTLVERLKTLEKRQKRQN